MNQTINQSIKDKNESFNIDKPMRFANEPQYTLTECSNILILFLLLSFPISSSVANTLIGLREIFVEISHTMGK